MAEFPNGVAAWAALLFVLEIGVVLIVAVLRVPPDRIPEMLGQLVELARRIFGRS